MREGYIVSRIMKAVRKKYPAAYVRKMSDRFTRGLPDVLIVALRSYNTTLGYSKKSIVLFVETKTDKGVCSKIQLREHELIHDAGAVCIVARNVATVLAKLEEMGAVA